MRLAVREEVGVARAGEVVVGGVPLPCGAVRDPAAVALCGPDGAPVPVQVLRTERYPDASVRWLVVAFPCTVDPLGRKLFTLATGAPAAADATVEVIPQGSGVVLDTGKVRVLVGGDPFDPLSGLPGLRGARVELVDTDGVVHVATAEPTEPTIVHNGPLLARVEVTGRYRTGATESWAFAGTVTATAGAAHVDVDIRVVNDVEPTGPAGAAPDEVDDRGIDAAVAEWRLVLDTDPVRDAVCGAFDAAHRSTPPFILRHTGAGHPRGIFATSTVEGGSDWADVSAPGYADQWEWSELHGRPATNWMVAGAASGDVTVAVHRFGENHPAELAVAGDAVTVRFWPAGAGELRLTQGAARTRRVRVVAGADRRAGLRLDHPLVPHPVDALDSGALPKVLPYLPQRYPNLEAHIREELFAWYQSGQSLGFHDFGDSVQGIRTGPRTGYSANNEHDALAALTLHYLRSGERAYYDSAEAYADHLRDIDLIHHSSLNPDEIGGLRAHGRGHVHYVRARTPSGEVWTSIDTGHMWTEGLVLFSQVSGDSRYLEAAERVGDCLVRLERIGWTRPEPGPRNSGWPLLGLTALARATGASRYLDAARATAQHALSAQRPDGRWLMRLGLADDYCAWQNAVLLSGLAQLLALEDDPRLRSAFVAGANALVDLGRNPDGTFIYLSRFDYRWANRSALIREALASAYQVTGEQRFLAAGLAGGARWYRPQGAGPALSNDIAEWRGHLPFLALAHEADLLTDLASGVEA